MRTSEADVLVKGGLLVNGHAMQRADVLVHDGRVIETGADLGERAAGPTSTHCPVYSLASSAGGLPSFLG